MSGKKVYNTIILLGNLKVTIYWWNDDSIFTGRVKCPIVAAKYEAINMRTKTLSCAFSVMWSWREAVLQAVAVLQRALAAISRPKFIHSLQKCRFHSTDLLIQLRQVAGLKDKLKGKNVGMIKRGQPQPPESRGRKQKSSWPEREMSLVACAGDSTKRSTC